MTTNPPPPRSPHAPPAAVTNCEVALARLPPPSAASPASPRRAGAANLFQDCSEKRASDLASTGYSPAKKKGGRRLRGTSVSPRDAYLIDDGFPSDESDDEDYLPTPIVPQPPPKTKKKGDGKVILDNNFFTYLRPSTFDKDLFIRGHPTIYSEEDMLRFDANFQKQLSFNFCATRATRKKTALMQDSRASRLRDIDLDVAPASFSLATTDRHELSRYILEDLLSRQVGCRLIVCIRASTTGNPTEISYSDQALHLVQQRKNSGHTTETWRMAGAAYHVMQGTLIRATMHNELMSTKLSTSRFTKSFFNKVGDFGFSFDGCTTILSVPWHDVIHCSNVIMFFGKSFDQSRPWGPVFRFKSDPEYAHHVFRQFASEYFGDSRVSSQLFAAYKECLNIFYRTRYATNSASISTITNRAMHTFSFDAGRKFQSFFDDLCRYSFVNCFTQFSDFSMPILSTVDFSIYLQASKHIFPEQWAFLSSHRNINRDRDGDDLTEFKERQVFISLLILQRMANFRCLPHWCLILSTAMYGWGTHDTISHATSFLGTTVSRTYRDRFYTSLTTGLVDTVIRLLSKEICCLMVMDNFQRGNQLRHQRGGRSNKFLIGTTEAAHRVVPFLNFSWDCHNVDLAYNKDQIVPAPLGMRSYECISFASDSLGTDLFVNHREITISDTPCFSGARVAAYHKAIRIRRNILAIRNSLSHGYNVDINRNVLPKFERYTREASESGFFKMVVEFQRDAVRDWNKSCDDVTLSYNMGFVGVSEDSSFGTAAVVLDMLLKFGVLIYDDSGTWKLHRWAYLRRLYCFGDRKTIENSTAFVNKLSNRSLSFEESSMQAQIFLDAFNRVMFLPGDWHTGMNMLQSIFKVFWADILKPFRDLLKWKRISNDVRGCYFQASRLVQYSNDVVTSYLIRLYISRYHDKYDDRLYHDEPADVLCGMAVDFDEFLSRSLSSLDEHLILIAFLWRMDTHSLHLFGSYLVRRNILRQPGSSWNVYMQISLTLDCRRVGLIARSETTQDQPERQLLLKMNGLS